MDASWAKVLTDWLQYLITGAAGGIGSVWLILSRRDALRGRQIEAMGADLRHHGERMADLEGRVPSVVDCSAHVQRITALETAQRLGVNQEDIRRAHLRMDGFEGRVGRMEGQLEQVNSNVNLIKNYLMEHGHRAGDSAHR